MLLAQTEVAKKFSDIDNALNEECERIASSPVASREVMRRCGMTGVLPYRKASDADPSMNPSYANTSVNNNIPSNLAIKLDPKVIKIIFSRMVTTAIYGEKLFGQFGSTIRQFIVGEVTGNVATYTDWENTGSSGANFNYPQRDAFYFQTNTKIGTFQQARWGMGGTDYLARANEAALEVLARFYNKSALYGVKGLRTYGVMNDPSLAPSIQASQKTSDGKTEWQYAELAENMYNDIVTMFVTLQRKNPGHVTKADHIILAMPTGALGNLERLNKFGTKSGVALVRENFPNIDIREIPEFDQEISEGLTPVSQAQMFLPKLAGQDTVEIGTPTKLTAFPVVQLGSHQEQKRASATWGAIWEQPTAEVTMVGI